MRNRLSLTSLFDRLQRRFSRARSGSILILVVALLMILAFIGAAFLTTARIDRYSAQQHNFNTQIDLLVEGVVNQVKGRVVSDLFGGGVFRAGDFGNFDLVDTRPVTTPEPHDRWLAARVPVFNSVTGSVQWPAISEGLNGALFESPYVMTSGSDPRYSNRTSLAPGFREIPAGSGIFHPAFGAYLAADADGDGIADAGLVRMPLSEINGITYFYATRVIDHSSAVNASIAWRPWNAPGAPATTVPGDFSPVNINLRNILPSDAEAAAGDRDIVRSSNYRFNSDPADDLDDTTVTTAPGLVPMVDPATPGSNPTPRADFAFNDVHDALWHQLGRRLLNPGYNTADAANGRYQAFQMSDQMALIYRFTLVNPNSGRSAIETALSYALTGAAPTAQISGDPRFTQKPYLANQVPLWFANHFNFDATLRRSPRPVLVARSPVSNLVPVKDYAGADPAAPTVPDGALVWNAANPRVAPKASVNTALFPELYRAFWSVMSPNGNDVPGTVDPTSGTVTPAPQFRSILRIPPGAPTDPTPPPAMTETDVLLIRAALAAVNTMDLRDGDDDVTTRQITLSSGLVARLNGYERQPFITQVYVDNYTAPNAGAAPPGDPGDPGDPIDPPPDPGGTVNQVEPGEEVNPQGYVAIELHNPYEVDLVLTNWHLGLVDRRSTPSPGASAPPFTYPLSIRRLGGAAPNGPLEDPAALTPGVLVIPAGGYVVLHNYSGTPTTNPGDPTDPTDPTDPVDPGGTGNQTLPSSTFDAQYIPPVVQAIMPTVADAIYVPNLHEVIEGTPTTGGIDPDTGLPLSAISTGGELVLLRPRRADGVYTLRVAQQDRPAILEADPNDLTLPNLSDLVPVDSYDFSNMQILPDPNTGEFQHWHYVRPNGVGTPQHWMFVYPGEYQMVDATTGTAIVGPRHIGTTVGRFVSNDQQPALAVGSFGGADPVGTYVNDFAPIQLMNTGMPGPNSPWDRTAHPALQGAAAGHAFPFGGFARNGDMLAIPFIGSYALYALGASGAYDDTAELQEMNAVSMDAAHADDLDDADNAQENIGRFTPIHDLALDPPIEDYEPLGSYDGSSGVIWRYHWATRLFDYLSVHAPHDDYLPNVSHLVHEYADPVISIYPGPTPAPISNRPPPGVANTNEELVPIEGLININTAPWYVLAQLPFVPTDDDRLTYNPATGRVTAGTNSIDDNIDIAKAIVYFRDVDDGSGAVPAQPGGPFRSIFELNRVPNFQDLWMVFAPADPLAADGDLSPLGAADGITGDYESQFLMVNRVSNLVTTRSDMFTCFVLVQGWRNIGTSNPELVVQRRAAFIVDRSNVTPGNADPVVYRVPTD